ncbi:acyltransferase family protein [Hydrogenophaga electricum]|uniref:Acyltransferase 3 domain-containing protein n=1 Tax=Hydrogenophaga electricum TaxID=1230953 RepID=A0ABQ6C3L3_9BURK|nr:acyltransferase family protein [Hydrogenophaga electricum]GLS14923.1 hypothetical protein GCM10007935_23560 [Hydrogenophaga electricum]
MSTPRQPGIDLLKVLASQLIVLHHLSAYGPVAEAMHRLAPAPLGWLYGYARMAVQVFLVLGGYLAVQRLAPAMAGHAGALARTVWRRYLRLAPPFLVALLLALVAAAWARPWLGGDVVPEAPTWRQWLAHAALLHETLDVDALSAGVWYVAIDFQLYALLALLLWLGQRGGQSVRAMALVIGATALSLGWWNRYPGLDDGPLYFLGAYGLGVAARWAGEQSDRWQRIGWLGAMLLVGALALVLEFRTRIALALAVAFWLALTQGRYPALPSGPAQRVLGILSRSSYALFLVHFPVLLLGNALFERAGLHGGTATIAAFALMGATSVALGWAFERWVEAPLAQGIGSAGRRRAPPLAG